MEVVREVLLLLGYFAFGAGAFFGVIVLIFALRMMIGEFLSRE